MQTHRDSDHAPEIPDELREAFKESDAFRDLKTEAERMVKERLSEITAGAPDEEPVREWDKYGVFVRELPERDVDEPLDLVRISVGGQETGERIAYCVFRGPIAEVKAVLRRAVNALRDAPD